MRIGFLLLLVSSFANGQNVRDQAWDVLKTGMEDGNPEKRVHAITAISSLGSGSRPVAMLEKSLRDKDSGVRQTAAALLGEIHARQSIPKLRAAIDDDDPQVGFTAARSLWEMGDRSGRKLFEEVLLGERKQGPGLMQGAMRDAKAKLRNPSALAMMGIKEASGALLGPASLGVDVAQEIMKDKGAPGRTLSATLLSESCDSRERDLMEAVLDTDHNWGVRVATARALGRCGNAATVKRLREVLEDSHDAVRMMVAASIIRLTERRAAPSRERRPARR